MELFTANGCLTDEGLDALIGGGLDELGRLEAAEHLAYCDHCLDRYTARLDAQPLEAAPPAVARAVMSTIWVRIMQNTYGRMAVAGVAALLALTIWRSGTLETILRTGSTLDIWAPPAQAQLTLPEKPDRPLLPEKPAQDARPGPAELYDKVTGALLDGLWGRSADRPTPDTTNDKGEPTR